MSNFRSFSNGLDVIDTEELESVLEADVAFEDGVTDSHLSGVLLNVSVILVIVFSLYLFLRILRTRKIIIEEQRCRANYLKKYTPQSKSE